MNDLVKIVYADGDYRILPKSWAWEYEDDPDLTRTMPLTDAQAEAWAQQEHLFAPALPAG